MTAGSNELGSVLEKIKDYCYQYHVSLPNHADQLHNIDDLFEQNQQWPHAECQGVYCIFSDEGKLLYVGKASMTGTIGSRLSCHFWKTKAPNKKYEFDGTVEGWGGHPSKLFVRVTSESWEAPSLEEFLIKKLRPSGNVRGVK